MHMDTITLTDSESQALRKEFGHILTHPESKTLRDVLRSKIGSEQAHHTVGDTLDYSYLALKHCLSPETFARLKAYAENPAADILVLENLPERPELDDASRTMVNPDLGASYADLFSYGYARLMGAQSLSSFKIDQVVKSSDDNLHQDGMFRGIPGAMTDYNVSDVISLQCIRPGVGGHATTLYTDLNAIVAQLDPSLVETLASHRFIPPGSRERLPILQQENGHWTLHPAFALNNPFSAGQLSAGSVTTDMTGREALKQFEDFKPLPSADMYETQWKPGMHVLARQDRLFHRRYVANDEPVHDRLLNRVRLFSDGHTTEPTASLDTLRDAVLSGIQALKKEEAETEQNRRKWDSLKEGASKEVIRR